MNDYDQLAERALSWLDDASPQELWDVMHRGALDARVGMPGVDGLLGRTAGPGPDREHLETREWARGATEDFAGWFLGTHGAQVAAAHEIRAAIAEMALDLGEAPINIGRFAAL